jgi:hypothetical protein
MELMEVYNELMLADKGYHALATWQREVIDQAIEVSNTQLMVLMEVNNELMLADKGYHALAAWQGEIIDQAIEVSYT